MNAAVSDFKVKKISKNKIKKRKKLILELVPTIDILQNISQIKGKENIFIGFAAETKDIINNARKKLIKKKLDMIVINPVNKTNYPFDSDYNRVYFMDNNKCVKLPGMKKTAVAQEILKYICNKIKD